MSRVKAHLRLIHITAFSACICGRRLRCSPVIEKFLSLRWCSSLRNPQTAAASVNEPLCIKCSSCESPFNDSWSGSRYFVAGWGVAAPLNLGVSERLKKFSELILNSISISMKCRYIDRQAICLFWYNYLSIGVESVDLEIHYPARQQIILNIGHRSPGNGNCLLATKKRRMRDPSSVTIWVLFQYLAICNNEN